MGKSNIYLENGIKDDRFEKIWLGRIIKAILDDEVTPDSPPGIVEENFIVKRLGIDIEYRNKAKDICLISELEPEKNKEKYLKFGKFSRDQIRYLLWKKAVLDKKDLIIYKFGEKNYLLPGLNKKGHYNEVEMHYYEVALCKISEAKKKALSKNLNGKTTFDIQSYVIDNAISLLNETPAISSKDRIALSKQKEKERLAQLKSRSVPQTSFAIVSDSEVEQTEVSEKLGGTSGSIQKSLQQARAGLFKKGQMSFV